MKLSLLHILRCPNDAAHLDLKVSQTTRAQEVQSGKLVCVKCQRTYPIVKGIPRFVTSDGYVNNFSFEWERHSRTQLVIDRQFTQETFHRRTGFTPQEIKDKLLLDAGCGMGRYMDVALRCGAEVVGIDMSLSVEQAAANLSHQSRAHFVQADITKPPFLPSAFDYIFSLGVLHHTPDPAATFAVLTPYLKPGGVISVSVYQRYPGLYEDCKRWRHITTRMNKRILYVLTSLAALVLYPVYRFPILNLLFHYVPISMHSNYEWRRLDTFDAYSPKYASTHTHYEVYKWFRHENLVDIEVLPKPVSMRGRKPK